jgi:hypothetical protein
LRLFAHCERAAARRTFQNAGNSRAMSTAMMPRTTSNSMNVKARRVEEEASMGQHRVKKGNGRGTTTEVRVPA